MQKNQLNLRKNLFIKKIFRSYNNGDATENVINYIFRLKNFDYIGGTNVFPYLKESIVTEYAFIRKKLNSQSNTQIFHIIVSTEDSIKDINLLHILAESIMEFFSNTYQVVYSIHDDKKNLHMHIVGNNVNLLTGKTFTDDEYIQFIEFANKIWENQINSLCQINMSY